MILFRFRERRTNLKLYQVQIFFLLLLVCFPFLCATTIIYSTLFFFIIHSDSFDGPLSIYQFYVVFCMLLLINHVFVDFCCWFVFFLLSLTLLDKSVLNTTITTTTKGVDLSYSRNGARIPSSLCVSIYLLFVERILSSFYCFFMILNAHIRNFKNIEVYQPNFEHIYFFRCKR